VLGQLYDIALGAAGRALVVKCFFDVDRIVIYVCDYDRLIEA